jgi:hypothetical protein
MTLPSIQSPEKGEKSCRIRRYLLVAIGAGILVIVTLGAWWVFREISSDKFAGGRLTTDTWSRDLPSQDERIRFLRRYFKFRTQVLDCEFHIVYHDNGFAPSDWAISTAVRVAPADVPSWLQDAAPAAGDSVFDYRSMVPARWNVKSSPEFLGRGTTQLVVFRPEGVVAIFVYTR